MNKNSYTRRKTGLSNDSSNSDGYVNREIGKEKGGFLINATEKTELSELRSDVDALSNDVHTAVGDLKKSIADLRSTVSEMENPFNVLRTVTNDKELEKLNAARLPPGVKSIVLGKPEENTISEKELTEISPKKSEPAPQTEAPTKEKPAITPQAIAPSKPIKPSAYIDWIWELLDTGLTAENIHQLANLCEMTNYLPKQASEFICSLAVTAEKIRSIGYNKSHLLLFMYKAASISKTNLDSEDMAKLIDLTDQHVRAKEKNEITIQQQLRPKKKSDLTKRRSKKKKSLIDQKLRPKKKKSRRH